MYTEGPISTLAERPKGRRRLRFSLTRMLLVTAAIALLVGLTQARRRSMRQSADDLSAAGVEVFYRPPPLITAPVGLSDDWIDKIWQRCPTGATLRVVEITSDRFRVGSLALNRQELLPHLLALESRARELGPNEIQVSADGAPPYTPSNWVNELAAQSSMTIYYCEKGDSTYHHVPGLPVR